MKRAKATDSVSVAFDMLEEQGFGTYEAELLVANPTLAKEIVEWIRLTGNVGEYAAATSWRTAKRILKGDMYGLEDVERVFRVRYTPEERAALSVIPYTEAFLRELQGAYVLFPGFRLTVTEMQARRSGRVLLAGTKQNCRQDPLLVTAAVEPRWYLFCAARGKDRHSPYQELQREYVDSTHGPMRTCEVTFAYLLEKGCNWTRLFGYDRIIANRAMWCADSWTSGEPAYVCQVDGDIFIDGAWRCGLGTPPMERFCLALQRLP